MTGDEGQTPFIDIPRGGNQIQAPAGQSGNGTSPAANAQPTS